MAGLLPCCCCCGCVSHQARVLAARDHSGAVELVEGRTAAGSLIIACGTFLPDGVHQMVDIQPGRSCTGRCTRTSVQVLPQQHISHFTVVLVTTWHQLQPEVSASFVSVCGLVPNGAACPALAGADNCHRRVQVWLARTAQAVQVWCDQDCVGACVV